MLDRDVIHGIKRPKTQNLRETSDISDTDVRRIFAAIDSKKFNSEAYKAILAVGFFTGLRSAEIRNLRIKNVGHVDGIKLLHMTIKGDKPHEIPLHPFVIKALSQHMERLKEMGFAIDDPEHVLFPSLKTKVNRPISQEALSYIFRTSLEKAGIEKSDFRRYSPHSMRATFAGHLLNTIEAPLEDVQAALGHANPSTTQKYNKIRKAHEKSPVYRIDY
ncbi:MAG TPA: tyrosine-type recombinase/integrase [Oligoflexus sp.]|uniref:tyrosine-type recombinase/integrase n=1 Tax=Oligoflexus sp. TaxID=1971216 RepID=UPI002D2EA3CA|nr:tyrosine-type recombinase/integrase [Oligoflexus sp.]HYX36915.1 tyrosine-type recombinase/integrase [Oligoflexus sp.]